MSLKVKGVNKNNINDIRKDEQFSKEKQELTKLIENINDSSLPFSLLTFCRPATSKIMTMVGCLYFSGFSFMSSLKATSIGNVVNASISFLSLFFI